MYRDTCIYTKLRGSASGFINKLVQFTDSKMLDWRTSSIYNNQRIGRNRKSLLHEIQYLYNIRIYTLFKSDLLKKIPGIDVEAIFKSLAKTLFHLRQ